MTPTILQNLEITVIYLFLNFHKQKQRGSKNTTSENEHYYDGVLMTVGDTTRNPSLNIIITPPYAIQIGGFHSCLM